ncbi:hypothetical protein N7519_009728 [Penicillium mononematosum]|uniref:uncharacterized protein n=1 Tax=Penicillium mononematosum TaxID=268346 RepID=UPI002547A489|nr:uncharacterized protein N7519_009728 [Penicillium mononematosum]KAJ6179267.1 hypothetical protein N7519_009728 [Penicillium mononematosum]
MSEMITLPSSLWAQALVTLGLLFVIKLISDVFFSRLRSIPGPALAKITDFWRASHAYGGRIDLKNVQLHRKYGTAVQVGPNCSDMYRPNDVLLEGHRMSNLFNTQDEDWHNQNIRPIRSLWSMTKVLEYEPFIDETITKFVDKLALRFVDGDNAGKVCPADEWIGFFAWDVTANFSFGRHYGFIDQEKDVDNLITDSTAGLRYFAPVSQIPWIDNILDKNPIKRIGPKPTLTGVLYAFKVVAEYQAQLAEKKISAGIVDHTLDKYVQLKETYPNMVDDNQIVNWLMLSILAGGDTSSATMRAVVYYLANQTCHRTPSRRYLFPAPWKEIRDLPYLDAVIREALRINPGIAMIFERVVPEGGFTLPDGRYLPAGTKAGINPFVTNRDFGVFGDDADDFNPDRWLQGKDESPGNFEDRLRRMKDTVDLSFGGGGRVCMGRYLAMLEIKKLIASLYSLFDIQLVDPKHEWNYQNAWFVYQYDMPMVIRRR